MKFSKGYSLSDERLLEESHENIPHTSKLTGISIYHPYFSYSRSPTTADEEKYSLGVNPSQNQMFQSRAVSENVQRQPTSYQMVWIRLCNLNFFSNWCETSGLLSSQLLHLTCLHQRFSRTPLVFSWPLTRINLLVRDTFRLVTVIKLRIHIVKLKR